MASERVRIGLGIRQPTASIKLNGEFRVVDGNGHEMERGLTEMTQLAVSSPSPEPIWSARLHSFYSKSDAEALVTEYRAYGVEVLLRRFGRMAEWGEGNQLNAFKYAVVFGEETDREQLSAMVGEMWANLPLLKEHLPGWKRFENELPRFDLVRSEPEGGGEIELTTPDGNSTILPSPLILTPLDESSRFTLGAVRIGIDFHWDHNEDLNFRGGFEVHVDGDALTLINDLDLEDYLASVLGSEMRSDWPEQALAAQAVAARSTVLATRGSHHGGELFDLCHDDHCQDYQGASRESETSRKALNASSGWLLTANGNVVDARFAKTCGGIVERYETAWDDESVQYLRPVACCAHEPADGAQDLIAAGKAGQGEEVLRTLLEDPPKWAACNPETGYYPESVESMRELFRWRREIPATALRELVRERTGRDLGAIQALKPLEYGVSGRIIWLSVVGEAGEVVVGKELAIRRLLSESHLPSSAFEVQKAGEVWVLEGIGWGHGVGLCQFGASTMAERGWNAEKILRHYYPITEILRYSATV